MHDLIRSKVTPSEASARTDRAPRSPGPWQARTTAPRAMPPPAPRWPGPAVAGPSPADTEQCGTQQTRIDIARGGHQRIANHGRARRAPALAGRTRPAAPTPAPIAGGIEIPGDIKEAEHATRIGHAGKGPGLRRTAHPLQRQQPWTTHARAPPCRTRNVVSIANAMNNSTASDDRLNRAPGHTPWPLVQPPPCGAEADQQAGADQLPGRQCITQQCAWRCRGHRLPPQHQPRRCQQAGQECQRQPRRLRLPRRPRRCR